MAFPFVFEDDFESGDNSGWDSETDSANQLDFPHYSVLAGMPNVRVAPYKGAYCARWQLTGGTADAILVEGDLNVGADTTNWFRFHIYFSTDFDATADDTVHLFELKATATVEATFGFRYVAATDVINFGIGETAPTSWTAEHYPTGKWYCIELAVDVDAGTANDGTIDLYVTEEGADTTTAVSATQVGSLNQGAITSGELGVTNHLATTTGTILIDQFAQDDARIYPAKRWGRDVLMTKNGHVFVGNGTISNVSLLSGAGTDCVVSIYDSDKANSLVAGNIVMELKNTANNEVVDTASDPVEVSHGAYVVMTGTNPRCLVQISGAAAHGSDGAVRALGARR